jgi:hypothetical protein
MVLKTRPPNNATPTMDECARCAPYLFEQIGDMMILTGKTIVSAVRPPYPYGGEFMSQFLFALKLCWF